LSKQSGKLRTPKQINRHNQQNRRQSELWVLQYPRIMYVGGRSTCEVLAAGTDIVHIDERCNHNHCHNHNEVFV